MPGHPQNEGSRDFDPPHRHTETRVPVVAGSQATVTTPGAAPLIVAQRLRKAPVHSARGGRRLVADAVKTARRLLTPDLPVLVRMDPAFYGRNSVGAVLAGGAQVSVTTRMVSRVKAAIRAGAA